MDRITKSLLNEFVVGQGLSSSSESEAFEYFANFATLHDKVADTIELDEVAVGEEGNTGIDGIAVILNGVHVTTEEDANSVIDSNGFLDATFIFVQAKTSSSFDLGDLSTFFFAVSDFFSDKPKLIHSEATKELIALKDYIYSRSGEMSNRNPDVILYYVCTGKWTNDPTLQARADAGVTELRQTQLFHDVTFTPVDAALLQKLYRSTKGKASARFSFSWRVALPEIKGVSEAHFGVLSAKEFLKLVVDDGGNIRKTVFYDNVRDFQDFNEVNKDIRTTLQSSDKSLFALLNNGVTVIARAIRPTGNTFHVEDFQIVNGCQTSHVLFHEKANLSDDVFIPIKIISTGDDSLVNKIIKATNFQTEVKPDQLYALSDFQKRLEDFYSTFEGDQKLYYERRARQYANSVNIVKTRIVTIQQQIRAYVSMFLDEPHRGHYPRSLGPVVGRTIFARDHQTEPYFVSAYAQFKLENLFRSKGIEPKYKPARYHLLMGIRHILNPYPLPSGRSNDIRRMADRLLASLGDDKVTLNTFKKAAAVIRSAVGKRSLDRNLTKTQPFTEKFKAELLQQYPLQGQKATTK